MVAYWNERGERPSRETACNALTALAGSLKAANCRVNTEVVHALIPDTPE